LSSKDWPIQLKVISDFFMDEGIAGADLLDSVGER